MGALRYLYDEVGIAPSVITGTSAGSILGAVLAQSGDHRGQRTSLADLERLWGEMTSSADMFEELPWFTRLRERGPVWIEALERRKRRQGTLGRSFKRVADLRHGISAAAERAVRNDDDAPQEPSASPDAAVPFDAAAVTAPPTRLTPDDDGGTDASADGAVAAGAGRAPEGRAARRRTATAEVLERTAAPREATAKEESAWGTTRLLESIEILKTVGRVSTDLETIVHGAQQERSMFRPGPIVDRLLDPEVFDPAAVARSGVRLRIAVVALESGELRYVTEAGDLVDRENRPLEGERRVDLTEAVRASCAIPTVFPPVRLGEENYVDGGVRESLPAEIATDHLGVDTCYAVVAGPSGVSREESFDGRDMLSVVMRTTTAIMTDELQRDEVAQAKAAGAVVIEPEFDVHDTLTIEPGLVAIAMDYGYLRAAETVLGSTAEERAVTRELVLLRRRIWHAEEEALAPEAELGDARRLEVVTGITGLKFELRDLLRRVPEGRLPPGAEQWWRTWEHHTFDIPVTPTWVPARAER